MRASLLVINGKITEAIALLEPAAQQGNAEAQWQLFRAYSSASPPDFNQSDIWLRRAAESGSVSAKIVLQSQKNPRPDKDGKVDTQTFLAYIRSLGAAKVATFDEKTLACYGLSESEFIAISNTSFAKCYDALPSNEKERVLPTIAFTQRVAMCANNALFQKIGKTLPEISKCLPVK
jgi:hypothetical protein